MVDISSLSGISSSQQQQNIQRSNARLQAAIASLVSGSRLNQASDDIASLSIAAQLQSSTSGLRQASANLAQASSLAQVADGGIEQVQNVLQELSSLAQQAGNPTLNPSNRAALNQQFQQLVQEADRIVSNTSFNNQKLLNGDLTGDNELSLGSLLGHEEGTGESLAIQGLSTGSLFNGQSLNLLSADSAKAAVEALGNALGQTTAVRATVGAFQQSVNFAAANIDSVIGNQEAAISTLQDTDFAEASSEFSLANIQRNLSLAIAAQSNRLSPGILKLLG